MFTAQTKTITSFLKEEECYDPLQNLDSFDVMIALFISLYKHQYYQADANFLIFPLTFTFGLSSVSIFT
jgi:hypothetical protein